MSWSTEFLLCRLKVCRTRWTPCFTRSTSSKRRLRSSSPSTNPSSTALYSSTHHLCDALQLSLSSNHHHQQDNPHYQGYNQNILLQKLQFQLAFLAAELEGIIREIFNEDVRGEKQWLGIVTFTMLTTSIALMMMKSWHFLVIKGGDLKDRLSYLEEELLFKLEVFNHTSQTFLSTSPPCTTQGAEQRARVGDGPHQDGH